MTALPAYVLFRPLGVARRTLALACCAVVAVLLTAPAHADGFSALVTPPRFEDRAKAGATYRNTVEITNASDQAARYSLKTADWTLRPDASVVFFDALAAGSCRPWVAVEATQITVAPGAKRRYRFEVAVPADAPAGECRFALLLEGDPQSVKGNLAVPVAGRIGIIVYLAIGDAGAQMSLTASKVATLDGRRVPVLSVRNAGNAHGRLEGFIDGKDSAGKAIAFLPSSFPILPGETREIALTPQGDGPDSPAPAVSYPVELKGKLEWDGKPLLIEATVAP